MIVTEDDLMYLLKNRLTLLSTRIMRLASMCQSEAVGFPDPPRWFESSIRSGRVEIAVRFGSRTDLLTYVPPAQQLLQLQIRVRELDGDEIVADAPVVYIPPVTVYGEISPRVFYQHGIAEIKKLAVNSPHMIAWLIGHLREINAWVSSRIEGMDKHLRYERRSRIAPQASVYTANDIISRLTRVNEMAVETGAALPKWFNSQFKAGIFTAHIVTCDNRRRPIDLYVTMDVPPFMDIPKQFISYRHGKPTVRLPLALGQSIWLLSNRAMALARLRNHLARMERYLRSVRNGAALDNSK